ncbi:glycerate kinase isoform X2 [Andrena cerasifolii]|uniref:glycerate kinase isoform X2 n=1 Tax=Andrena cerasifolii TaxID=2819439 RepID=UPI004037EA0B
MRYKIVLRKFVRYRQVSVPFKCNLPNVVKFTSGNMSTDARILEESKSILKRMYLAGVQAVSPKALILNKVKFEDGILQIGEQSFELKENVYLVGFGKAVLGMSIVLEHKLGDYLKKGIVSIPSASTDAMWESDDKSFFPKLATGVVTYREGGVNNQPDERCLETTHEIIDLVESLTENDTLIVLISGGGSALLYMPRPVIDQDDKLMLCKMLQNAGADIKELNIVRRKLSMVKGGGLARMAYPASVITLILSDIVGDPIDLIASGPTVYSNKDPRAVMAVLRKYDLLGKIEGDLKRLVMSKETFRDRQLLTRGRNKQFKHVSYVVLGNNSVAVEAACLEAANNKLTPIVLGTQVTGDVHDVSLAYAHITSLICLALDNALEKQDFFDKVKDIPILPLSASKVDEIYNMIDNLSEEGLVLIGAGEPTVVVKGEGKGGRNQELALHFSLDWLAKIKTCPGFAKYDVIMLSAGTDGQDGPTDAAGAYGYPAIGPMIHDLHAQAKSLASKKIVEAQKKRDAIKKQQEEYEQRQKPIEICKKQELSGYLTKNKVEAPKKPRDEVAENEVANGANGEEAEDEEDALPLILLTMEIERMMPENALQDSDTYNLYSRFKNGADLIKTGFSGTNVMDLHFIYISKRHCDCRIDFMKGEITENLLSMHDLHIDPSTLEKCKRLRAPLAFDWASAWYRQSVVVKEKPKQLNIKIVDDNLSDPCCRRDRKFPPKNLLENKELPL